MVPCESDLTPYTMRAFFDESGTHAGSPIMCVAGYVINSPQAAKFESEWKEQLKRYGLTHFHMKEFAHATGRYGELTKDERLELQKQLIGIITRRTEIGLSVSLDPRVAERIFREHHFLPKVNPYTLCVLMAVFVVMEWVWVTERKEPIACFFEAGHDREADANRAMAGMSSNVKAVQEMRYVGHRFMEKEDSCGLEAADLIAWESHYDQKRELGYEKRARRRSFEVLGQAKAHYWRHFDEEHLRSIVHYQLQKEEGKQPPRPQLPPARGLLFQD